MHKCRNDDGGGGGFPPPAGFGGQRGRGCERRGRLGRGAYRGRTVTFRVGRGLGGSSCECRELGRDIAVDGRGRDRTCDGANSGASSLKRMVMNKRGMQVVSAGAWLLLAGLAATPVLASVDPAPASHTAAAEDEAAADAFPIPEALRDNVEFWRKVFAEWRQSQVAVHDMDYPGIVYQVIEIKGEVNDSLTDAQRDQVNAARDEWEACLQRVAKAEPIELSAEELALRQRIVEVAGAGALAEAYLRVRTQRGVRERFLRGLAHSGRYAAVFRRIFQEAGLPEDLAYLPHVESSFQNHARSSVGATGMWQFTRSAGRTFMTVNNAVDERLDPVASARGAARYLGQAYQQLGDWALAVTSYNHGMQGMARAKAEFGTDFSRIVREYKSRSFGFAARNFYAEFLAARDSASQPERYFPEGVDFERPLRMDSVTLERAAHARDIASRYGVPVRKLVVLFL